MLFLPTAFAAAATFAQSLSYSLLPPGEGDRPSERIDGVIVYDPQDRQILLFGGQDFTGARNDLWSYSIPSRRWTALNPAAGSPKPAPRFGHTVVFDSARRRLVVFGGQAAGFFSDVWAYEISANAWRQLSRDDAGPSRRYGHSVIYEPGRDRMIISHGFTNSGRFDDTWSFDLNGNTWRNISPSSGRPLRRCLHHAVHDSINGEMLLYAGCSSGSGPCPQADLWSFDLATHRWTERTPRDTNPSGREHYGVAFDAGRGRMVVFGGTGNGGFTNDTWAYDPATRRWSAVAIEGGLPSARFRHQGAAGVGVLFFFGGSTETGYSNELWMLSPPMERPMLRISNVRNVFSNLGDAVAPGEIVRIDALNLPGSDVDLQVLANGVVAQSWRGEDGLHLIAYMPPELSGASEAKVVLRAGNEMVSEAWTVPVRAAHPALWGYVTNGDGSVNSVDNPVAPGDVVVLLATGTGLDSGGLTVWIGGAEAEVVELAPVADAVGLLRLAVRVPRDLAAGDGVPVVLRVAGYQSPEGDVLISVGEQRRSAE
jgi:uncharacterized protein (TIGR03437 family)